MERIGIFGGTFNPIHQGHVRLAQQYIRELKLDKLLVIPTKFPPHKLARDLAPAADRLEMCRLAFRDIPQAEISDLEIRRKGKSYTVDTIRQLKQDYPDSKLFLLVGGDMFRSFKGWVRFDEILQNCTLCTAARERGELRELNRYRIVLEQYSENLLILDVPVLELSSTEIRQRVAAGQSCEALLDDAVIRYIAEKQLYQPEPTHETRVAQYTELIADLLKPSRFEHSLNVAKRAVYLAQLHGEDEKKAEIAGLLHDICKNMSQEEQLHWTKKSAIIFDKSFWAQPQLWHGFAAAEYLREELAISDPEILEAVRWHTVGKADMSTFEKIIFLADLTSAERSYPSAAEVRAVVDASLDEGMKVSLLFTVGKLVENQQPICRDTWLAYNHYVPLSGLPDHDTSKPNQ